MCVQEKVNAVMEHSRRIRRRQGPNWEWVKWTNYRHRLSITTANNFFIGVMLDQLGNTKRAWEAAEHFVTKHFNQVDNLWQAIIEILDVDLDYICQYGYNGKSYAVFYATNKFPIWLRENARRMIEVYDSDPRNIWNYAEVNQIRDRFEEFDGIGIALSRMATNDLVRGYGVAGGWRVGRRRAGGQRVREQLFLKPDVLLKRVMKRVGFIENNTETQVLNWEQEMKNNRILRSPADFDAAIWEIGNNYCSRTNPNCEGCHINHVCDYWNG